MSFILMQSFTANLSAILTLDQLSFSFSEDWYFGYHEGYFLKSFLTEKLNIKEAKLKAYSSVEEFQHTMSRGSKNGGVEAIFDELPYMKLLLNQYHSQYKIVGPTYRTDGLGFAFPIGSPLDAYFSRAILNVTQGPEMISLEQKNFGPAFSSQDPLSSMVSQGSSSLTSRQFAGLFITVGSLALIALACSETRFLWGRVRDIAAWFIIRRDGHGVNPDEGVQPDIPAYDYVPNQGGDAAPPGNSNASGDGDGINNEGGANDGANRGQDGGGGVIDDRPARNF